MTLHGFWPRRVGAIKVVDASDRAMIDAFLESNGAVRLPDGERRPSLEYNKGITANMRSASIAKMGAKKSYYTLKVGGPGSSRRPSVG